jgi:hypothetical protein
MQCFELTNNGVVKGLQVHAHPEPHINLTSDGSLWMDFDKRYTQLVQKAVTKYPRRTLIVHNLKVVVESDHNIYVKPCRTEMEALVYIRLTAKPKGLVFLSALNDRKEVCRRNTIVPFFAPFPPYGISVLGSPYKGMRDDEMPWIEGAQEIELTIVMMRGACFRIFRSAPKGVNLGTSVTWTGWNLKTRELAWDRGVDLVENEVRA